jgi:hypothetical protein
MAPQRGLLSSSKCRNWQTAPALLAEPGNIPINRPKTPSAWKGFSSYCPWLRQPDAGIRKILQDYNFMTSNSLHLRNH